MMTLRWMLAAALGALTVAGCSQDSAMPCSDCTPSGPMTFALPSPSGAVLWTTPSMEKVLREAAPPTNTGAAIELYAARNEFEPFQLVVRADSDATVTLDLGALSGPGTTGTTGTIDRIEIRRVGYVRITQPSDASGIRSSYVPDPLEPTAFGAMESVKGGQNQPFWITLYVPANAAAGDYQGTLKVAVGGAAQDVPVKLHVFDFALPAKIGFDGNWNASF